MSTSSADFTHYQGRPVGSSTPKERKESLAELVAKTRAREAAAEAERERIAEENHAKLLEGFRESIRHNPCFTDEEKAKIIADSFNW